MFHEIFSLFARLKRNGSNPKTKRLRHFTGIETLEDRSVPSATIGGFVYDDANDNGLMGAGDAGIGGVQVVLNNPNGPTLTTTTAANGSYQFVLPDTTSPPGSATFNTTLNLSSLSAAAASGSIAQFNPALGQLTSVEIIDNSTLTSTVAVENLSTSPDTMTVGVTGSLMLQGTGISPINLNFTPPNDTAAVAGYAGSATVFTGPSSHNFGTQSFSNSQTIMLSGTSANLSAFEGTGSLNLSLAGAGSTELTAGSDGILEFGTTGQANVTVIYNYQPPPSFAPVTVTIGQPNNPPAGYIQGLLTAGNVTPIPGSATQNTLPPVTLHDGDNVTNYNFAELLPAQIKGFVYYDQNDNGSMDANEPGLGSVQVTLTGKNDLGQLIDLTQLTGADGSYDFSGLRPGNYTVSRGAAPYSYLDGKASVGVSGNGQVSGNSIVSIGLQQGMVDPNNDFGLVKMGDISGTVYNDVNDNGVLDGGDSLVGGVSLTLTGTNDLGQSITATATTNAGGSYDFGNLRPGTYTVTRGAAPLGYFDGKATAGAPGGGQASGTTIAGIVVQSDVGDPNNNFGLVKMSNISGTVYSDVNDNGVLDSGDSLVGNVAVTLTGTNDLGQAVTATVSTNAGGSYVFGNLRPGTYTVTRGAAPTGYADGKATAGASGGQASGTIIASIALQGGVNDPYNNFGLVQTASVSGFVYLDQDRAGFKDAGDPGIGNTTVTVVGTNDLGQSVDQVLVTAANGSYSLAGLRPGQYLITETPPLGGYAQGPNNIGTLNGVTSGTLNGNQFQLTIGAGNVGLNYNFGWLPEAIIPSPPPPQPPPPAPPPAASPPPAPPPPPALSKRVLTGSDWLTWTWE